MMNPLKCNVVSIPTRLIVGVMLFMASFTSYLLRVNMSINILGMAVPITTNSTSVIEVPDYGARYNWSVEDQSLLLGAYHWGFLISQLPGGLLTERFGGRHSIGYGLILSAVTTLLIPWSAKQSLWVVFMMRVLIGLFSSLISPATQSLISKWAPHDEKGKFVVSLFGGSMGTVILWPLAGYIMETMGWVWAFYLPALFTILTTFVWYYVVYDSPAEHPRITSAERDHIEASLGKSVSSVRRKTLPPFKSIFLSLPFWSLLVLHYGGRWSLFLLTAVAPKYMNEILKFNLANSGFLAGLPYLCRFIFSFGFASIGDAIRKRNLISVTTTRKSFCLFSHIIPGVLLFGLSYAGNNATACIILITISMGFNGASTITNMQNYQDLAPNYAASLYAIVNFVGTTSGFLSPMMVAYYTKENNTFEQWNIAFNITAIIYIVPAIFFIFFGSGKIQKWNDLEGFKQNELKRAQTKQKELDVETSQNEVIPEISKL